MAGQPNVKVAGAESNCDVHEDTSRLLAVKDEGHGIDLDVLVESLKKDMVIVVHNVSPESADSIVGDVADRLGLGDNLKLQAGFASILGHRRNIGRYFMSVNKRRAYQFVSPHCEGTSLANMQLASFYCYENSTDGGETILMNLSDSPDLSEQLREKVVRVSPNSRPLAIHEIARAKTLYRVNPEADIVREDDQVLGERASDIPGLKLLDVLAKSQRTHSRILDRKLHAYWDSIARIDRDSLDEYVSLLRQCGLLREPEGGLQLHEMDICANTRVWRSGINYAQLFKCKIIYKLSPRDLLIQNNVTWTHAVTNWTPDSGTRQVAAAFA